MNLSAWSIKNPTSTIVIFLILSIAGLRFFSITKVQHFPDLELPTISVNYILPGATAEQLENEVVRKLEDSLSSIQDLKHIYTTISQDHGVTILEFKTEKDAQEALEDVESNINHIKSDLPTELNELVINKINTTNQVILAFAIISKDINEENISYFIDNDVKNILMSVPGIGDIKRIGGVNREIKVLLDPIRMESLGITAAEISRLLKIMQNNGSGRLNLGNFEQSVRTSTLQSVEELKNIPLSLSDGRNIYLNQIANVEDSIAEKRTAAFFNGLPVVGFEITRSRGASDIEVGKFVRIKLENLKKLHNEFNIVETFDFVTPTQEEYVSSRQMLLEGALLAILIVLIFLKDLRSTIIATIALPVSILPAFIGMNLLGFSINIVTMLALSLVVGVLVDDVIVEIENIIRHLNMGKTAYDAAMEASKEIGLAVVATTLTLVSVFLPTAFMSGIVGKFFRQFGLTATLTVISSLAVARMLTPMMSAYLLKEKIVYYNNIQWIQNYKILEEWCLKHRIVTIFITGLFCLISLVLLVLIPKGFMPVDDNCQTQIQLELPPGSSLEDTKNVAENLRLKLANISYIDNIYTTIGSSNVGSDMFSPTNFEEVNKSKMTIHLLPRNQRPRKKEIEREIRNILKELPGIRASIGLGNSRNKYVLMLRGNEKEVLAKTAKLIENDLHKFPGLGEIINTYLSKPEFVVKINFQMAALLGVNSTAITDTIRIATMGDYNKNLPKLDIDQRKIPIMIRLSDLVRKDINWLMHLPIPSSRGYTVPLSRVAKIDYINNPSIINHYDKLNNININVDLSNIPLGNLIQYIRDLSSVRQMPTGINILEVGDAEAMQELFSGFSIAMLSGILCIYFILVVLFKHILHPLTILTALPLSIGGAFLGLFFTKDILSISSLIGMITLMGVSTKNSILLVEYAIFAMKNNNISLKDALIDAGYKRARPIIMTSLAMGAGMLPTALGWSTADNSFRSPMAITVIFGIITSTLLSLLIVPVIFSYMENISNFCFKLKFKKVNINNDIE